MNPVYWSFQKIKETIVYTDEHVDGGSYGQRWYLMLTNENDGDIKKMKHKYPSLVSMRMKIFRKSNTFYSEHKVKQLDKTFYNKHFIDLSLFTELSSFNGKIRSKKYQKTVSVVIILGISYGISRNNIGTIS